MIQTPKFTLSPLSQMVDELLMLLSESSAYHRTDDVKAILQEAIEIILAIRHRLELCRERFAVAIVGQTNVGKSTLMEALVGEEIVPRRNGPCTAAPVEFSWGAQFRVQAEFHRGLKRKEWECANAREVRQLLGPLIDESDASRVSPAELPWRVKVQMPLELLDSGLVIADTPGFGAAQLDLTREGSHDQSLQDYLQRDIAQIFWMVLGEQGILKRELDFHREFLAKVCDDLVVTGCDDWDEQDHQKFRARFSPKIGFRTPRFHFVSGLQAALARANGNAQQLESAGISQLEARIRDLANSERRETCLAEQVLAVTSNLGTWLHDFRDSRHRPLPYWWRPDSWIRWMDLPESTLKSKLGQTLTPRLA